jgi:hypothetical protein
MMNSMRLPTVALAFSFSLSIYLGATNFAIAAGDQCGGLFKANEQAAAAKVVSGTIGSDLFGYSLNLETREIQLTSADGSERFTGIAGVETHSDSSQAPKNSRKTYSVVRPGTWMGDLNAYTFTFDTATGLLERIGRQSVDVYDNNGSPIMPYRVTSSKNGIFQAVMGADKFKVSLNTLTHEVTLQTSDGSKVFTGKAVVEVLREKGQTVYSVIRPETSLGRVNAYTFVVSVKNGKQVLSRVGRESVAIGDRNGSWIMQPYKARRVANGTAVVGRMGKDDFRFKIDPETGRVELGEGAETEFQASLEVHTRTDSSGKTVTYHTYTVLRPSTWLTDLNVYQFTFVESKDGLKLDSVGRQSVSVQDRNGSAIMPFTVN